MSKFLAFFLILISQLIFFPSQILAVSTPTCKSMGITYAPALFSANPSDITINFAINDKTMASNIQKAGNVRLHFINTFLGTGVGFIGDINTKSVPVTVTDNGGSFTINVLDIYDTSPGNIRLQPSIDALKAPGQRDAVVDWQYKNRSSTGDSGDFDELCKGISFYVGSPYACLIDPTLQDPVPLGQPFTIAFSGKPSTEYQLYAKPDSILIPFTSPKYFVGKTTTYANGQGAFNNFRLSGISSGDKVNIGIAASDALSHNLNPLDDYTKGIKVESYNICTVTRQVSISATPKPAPSSVPTPGPGAGVVGPGTGSIEAPAVDICKIDPSKCTLASGDPCDGGKGIKTAIGCIHTDPEGFVKDFLSFAVGISGGLAFLMMLLGSFQMITSAGNPETLQAGRERFSSAIIGLLMVILAILFLKIIGVDILGIPGFTQ